MTKIGNFLILFFLSFSVFAENQTQVQAVVDRDEMGIGDSFTLTIRVQSNEDFEGQEPKLPTLNAIEVLNSWAGNQSSASRMEWINGKTNYSKTVQQEFNYLLSPKKEGKLIIPVIDVSVNGKVYKTQPVTIQVAEELRGSGGSAKPQGRAQRGQPRKVPGRPQFFDEDEDPFSDDNDPFSQLLKRQKQLIEEMQRGMGQGGNPGGVFGGPAGPIPRKEIPNVDTKEAFFVYADVDKTEAYEGQQVTANWYIYVKGRIDSLDRAKFPDLKGFWKEIIEEVPSLQFSNEIVNGVTYQKALLASHALFPIKAGVATIDEFKIKARVQMMTPYGLGQPHEWTKSSRRTPIKVLPLPDEGKPRNFSGAVGSFQVHLKTEGTRFPVNQPFSLKVRFEGSGNAKLIELPNIDWPPGLEVYDTKSESRFFKNGQSFKEFEVLLIPRKEGEITIPAIEFSHFNPEQKRYVTTTTEPLKLTINEGTAQSQGALSPGKSSGGDPKTPVVSVVRPQIEFPSANMISDANRWDIYLGVFALCVFAMLAYFFQQFRILKQDSTLQLIIEKKLKVLHNYLHERNFRQLGVEGVNLVYALAAHLSGQTAANQEWSLVVEKIPLQLKEKYLTALTKAFDYFQLLGFSPDGVHQSIVAAGASSEEIERLKKLAQDINSDLKNFERE